MPGKVSGTPVLLLRSSLAGAALSSRTCLYKVGTITQHPVEFVPINKVFLAAADQYET